MDDVLIGTATQLRVETVSAHQLPLHVSFLIFLIIWPHI